MSVAAASQLDFDRFRATALEKTPFPYLIVPGFLRPGAVEAVNADYPEIDKPGSFPVPELSYGPAFKGLLDEMNGPEMTAAFAEKFDVDLTDHPTMITVRGQCRAKDGQIHTDSKSKIITVLLYMNSGWEADGGRLRLLRSPDDLDDAIAEVPPEEGTLLAFLNRPNAWHGHKSFTGQRRTIQLNWVTDDGVVAREQARHRVSAKLKRLNPFA